MSSEPFGFKRKITLLGTGVILPHPERGQSSFLLETEDKTRVLFDCGSGTETRLARIGVEPEEIDHIILSHHHIDHDAGFMPLLKAMWLKGKSKIFLYGPQGTEKWYRSLLEVWSYMKKRIEVKVVEMSPGKRIAFPSFSLGSQEMTHSVPCLGYRLEFGDGTSLVYSGDTEPCKGLKKLLGKKTTVLIHECSFPETMDVTNHTTPETLARFLFRLKEEDGLRLSTIVLTHFYKQNLNRENKIVEIIKNRLPETEVFCGRDLMELTF